MSPDRARPRPRLGSVPITELDHFLFRFVGAPIVIGLHFLHENELITATLVAMLGLGFLVRLIWESEPNQNRARSSARPALGTADEEQQEKREQERPNHSDDAQEAG